MGQYAGNANNYPDSVFLIDDSVPPTATNINPGPQGALDRTAYLSRAIQSMLVNNFPYRMIDAAKCVSIDSAPVWSPYERLWLFSGVNASSRSRVFMARNNCIDTFENYGTWDDTTTNKPKQLCARPTDGRVLAVCANGVSRTCDPGGTFTTDYTAVTMTRVDEILWFGGKYIMPSYNAATSTFRVHTSLTGLLASYTNQTIPSAMSTSTNNMFIAASSSRWVCFTGTAAQQTYMTTDDGVTYTARTASFIASGEYVTDVTWTGTKFVLSIVTAANVARVYSSTDGLAWTLKWTSPASHLITFLAGQRDALIACFSPGAFNTMVSYDGGANWEAGHHRLLNPTSLASSGRQFAMTSGNFYCASDVVIAA